jgi:hypothetical protein
VTRFSPMYYPIRIDLNALCISRVKSFGCQKAAKWPPWPEGTALQLHRSRCAVHTIAEWSVL